VYDAIGRVVDQTDGEGGHVLFAWDDTSGVATITDQTGVVQSHEYAENVIDAMVDLAGTTSFA
jgi:YD repeat-containing protein